MTSNVFRMEVGELSARGARAPGAGRHFPLGWFSLPRRERAGLTAPTVYCLSGRQRGGTARGHADKLGQIRGFRNPVLGVARLRRVSQCRSRAQILHLAWLCSTEAI